MFSPPELIDISRYSHLFNSHLQVCVDRQVLPVASDTVDFMLSNNLAVDQAVLQILLHKLGKQNIWLRAREVFRRMYCILDSFKPNYRGKKLSFNTKRFKWDQTNGLVILTQLFHCCVCSTDSLSVGYYTGVSAPPGFLALIVPCRLWEVELALAFEMFIAVNATDILQHSDSSTSCLSITLKR